MLSIDDFVKVVTSYLKLKKQDGEIGGIFYDPPADSSGKKDDKNIMNLTAKTVGIDVMNYDENSSTDKKIEKMAKWAKTRGSYDIQDRLKNANMSFKDVVLMSLSKYVGQVQTEGNAEFGLGVSGAQPDPGYSV